MYVSFWELIIASPNFGQFIIKVCPPLAQTSSYATECSICIMCSILATMTQLQLSFLTHELKCQLCEILSSFLCCCGPFICVLVFASCFLSFRLIRLTFHFFQVRKERENLHEMVEYHNETKTTVLRHNGTESVLSEIWSRELVPGDVLVIPPGGAQLSCDAALVSGRSTLMYVRLLCIVRTLHFKAAN